MNQERRIYPRLPLAVLLEINSKSIKRSKGKGFITNLSEGGLSFETASRIKTGERLSLCFSLPNKEQYELNGEVVYAKPGVLNRAYGLRFKINENDELTKKIGKFVTSKT